MQKDDGGFYWVVGLPATAANLSQQEFDDLIARRCWEASDAAKQWRAQRQAAEREMNDAA